MNAHVDVSTKQAIIALNQALTGDRTYGIHGTKSLEVWTLSLKTCSTHKHIEVCAAVPISYIWRLFCKNAFALFCFWHFQLLTTCGTHEIHVSQLRMGCPKRSFFALDPRDKALRFTEEQVQYGPIQKPVWRFPEIGVPLVKSSISRWDFPWHKPSSELGPIGYTNIHHYQPLLIHYSPVFNPCFFMFKPSFIHD